jgi:hypothetical protein
MYNRDCKYRERREGTDPVKRPATWRLETSKVLQPAQERKVGDDATCRRPPNRTSSLFFCADEGLCVDVGEAISPCQRGEGGMGLYERLLEEREEEKRRRGRPLGPYRGIDSVVFDRLVGRASSKPPGYQGEILKLYQFVHRGAGGMAGGMWYGSLRARYPEEYRLLKAEREGYEQQEMFGKAQAVRASDW